MRELGRTSYLPVPMDETAAQVQTMTVFPSFRPSVCSMKPKEEARIDINSPAGKASQPRLDTNWIPVLQQAADKPKQTPACTCGFLSLQIHIKFSMM